MERRKPAKVNVKHYDSNSKFISSEEFTKLFEELQMKDGKKRNIKSIGMCVVYENDTMRSALISKSEDVSPLTAKLCILLQNLDSILNDIFDESTSSNSDNAVLQQVINDIDADDLNQPSRNSVVWDLTQVLIINRSNEQEQEKLTEEYFETMGKRYHLSRKDIHGASIYAMSHMCQQISKIYSDEIKTLSQMMIRYLHGNCDRTEIIDYLSSTTIIDDLFIHFSNISIDDDVDVASLIIDYLFLIAGDTNLKEATEAFIGYCNNRGITTKLILK